jgi:hypothetical protein
VIGEPVTINGRVWLRIGCIDVPRVHGRCNQCNHIYDWDQTDAILRRITHQDEPAPIISGSPRPDHALEKIIDQCAIINSTIE